MMQSPKRDAKQTRRSSQQESGPMLQDSRHEERQIRLPNQAAPVKRAENPPGPFRPESAREAICQILSPYAAASCIAGRGPY